MDTDLSYHLVFRDYRQTVFLRNMVRAVVGTLIDVGREKITMEQFLNILHNGSRSDAGESMPGNALFLEEVGYDLKD